MIGRVRFLVVSDAHVAAPGAPAQRWHNELALADSAPLLRRALDAGGRRELDVVAVLGDLAHSPREELPEPALAALEAVERGELRIVSGNEDPPSLGERAPLGSLASLEGEELRGWLRLAGLQVLSRDDGATAAAATAPPPQPWGEAVVALLSHFPLLSRAAEFGAHGLRYAGDLLGRAEWSEALLARSAPTVVLCGHLHARDAATAGRVLQLGFGALVEPPHEFSLVELEPGNGYPRVRRTTYSLARTLPPHDPALAPASEEWAFDGDGWRRLEAGFAAELPRAASADRSLTSTFQPLATTND